MDVNKRDFLAPWPGSVSSHPTRGVSRSWIFPLLPAPVARVMHEAPPAFDHAVKGLACMTPCRWTSRGTRRVVAHRLR